MTEQQTADKRTAILDAMLDLVAERGFHGTPMSQVAKHSGVSIGIIYHYFDNKDTLIHELYREIKVRYSRALLQDNPPDASWPDYFEQMWLNAYRFYVAHPRETRFLEQYENSPFAQDHMSEEAMAASDDEHTIALAQMIKKQFTDGIIREMPFAVLYELTIGVALALAKRQISQMVDLNEAELKAAAAACRRAIEA